MTFMAEGLYDVRKEEEVWGSEVLHAVADVNSQKLYNLKLPENGTRVPRLST